uniref:Uncharacterized protein n=1 Tax=Avena sativa TaxID=4498 RepID=A0ACD5TB93_AVESA
MLRLRSSLVSHHHRLLSTNARPVSPKPGFAAEDYLVDTCGLTRPQAIKASRQLSHLKSSSKPDAVLAFLAGHGFSSADVAATVAKYPKLLCSGVERTLAPRFLGLTGLGLSGPDIARLISIVGLHFRLRSVVSKVHFYLLFFGSTENFFRSVKRNSYILSCDLERKVKPNIALLRECVLDSCDVAKMCISEPMMLSTKPERIRAMVRCAEGLGVPRRSGMFRQALKAVTFFAEEKMVAKVDFLKKTFRWSDAEVKVALSKAPILLRRSEDTLLRMSEFLISEVGLEPAYIARRSVLLTCSMDGRLWPRYHVLKFLKANGLLDQNRDYYSTILLSKEVFLKKFICPHKEAAPHLAEDYETACRGELPTRFIFT